MKIKINDKIYEIAKLPQFSRLKSMLITIFSDNPNKFNFRGVFHEGRHGILVCGTDKSCIRDFQKFYPIKDIYFYFNKHVNHLREDGERRLTTI